MFKECLDYFRDKWFLQPFLIAIYIISTSIPDFGLSYIKWSEVSLVLVCITVYWTIVFIPLKLVFKDNDASCFMATCIVFTSLLFEHIHNTFFFVHWLRERHMVFIITVTFLFIISFITSLFKSLSNSQKKLQYF